MPLQTPALPQILWIVRHGQSAGNVARDKAEIEGLHTIDIADRDIDVPLSSLGCEQAEALGLWFATLESVEQPEIVLCSPYLRARETARLVLQKAGLESSVKIRLDERLREKEFGILDRLTVLGIKEKHPELSNQRTHVGKFYFRPPGGESWCDVILRLRSLTEMMAREHAGQRVLIIAHQVVVSCMRYLIEQMEEAQILAIDRQGDIPNCSVTSYRTVLSSNEGTSAAASLVLDQINFLTPLHESGTPVTSAADVAAAPKP